MVTTGPTPAVTVVTLYRVLLGHPQVCGSTLACFGPCMGASPSTLGFPGPTVGHIPAGFFLVENLSLQEGDHESGRGQPFTSKCHLPAS
jgi:hypothetical protein